MMPAVVAVTIAECLHNRMPFSLLRFSRPPLLGWQFSHQPLTFISFPATLAPPKHPFTIQEEVVKVQGGLKKKRFMEDDASVACFICPGWESLDMRATDKGASEGF